MLQARKIQCSVSLMEWTGVLVWSSPTISQAPHACTSLQFTVEKLVGASGMINYVDARTSWMDDIVREAVKAGMPQVVVLAAGYCTRAYRLAAAGTKVRLGINSSRPHNVAHQRLCRTQALSGRSSSRLTSPRSQKRSRRWWKRSFLTNRRYEQAPATLPIVSGVALPCKCDGRAELR